MKLSENMKRGASKELAPRCVLILYAHAFGMISDHFMSSILRSAEKLPAVRRYRYTPDARELPLKLIV